MLKNLFNMLIYFNNSLLYQKKTSSERFFEEVSKTSSLIFPMSQFNWGGQEVAPWLFPVYGKTVAKVSTGLIPQPFSIRVKLF